MISATLVTSLIVSVSSMSPMSLVSSPSFAPSFVSSMSPMSSLSLSPFATSVSFVTPFTPLSGIYALSKKTHLLERTRTGQRYLARQKIPRKRLIRQPITDFFLADHDRHPIMDRTHHVIGFFCQDNKRVRSVRLRPIKSAKEQQRMINRPKCRFLSPRIPFIKLLRGKHAATPLQTARKHRLLRRRLLTCVDDETSRLRVPHTPFHRDHSESPISDSKSRRRFLRTNIPRNHRLIPTVPAKPRINAFPDAISAAHTNPSSSCGLLIRTLFPGSAVTRLS